MSINSVVLVGRLTQDDRTEQQSNDDFNFSVFPLSYSSSG